MVGTKSLGKYHLFFFEVNTLHNQGVDQLAPELQVEAKAPDGLVEAFSLPQHKFFRWRAVAPRMESKKQSFLSNFIQ